MTCDTATIDLAIWKRRDEALPIAHTRMKKLLPWLAIISLLAGCAEFDTRVAQKTNLGNLQHIYVQHLLTDGRGIDQIIARELRRLGYDASAGPLTLMPADTEVVLLYQDRWTYDFTTYMIEIDMQLKTAHSDRLIAEGRSFRPSVLGNSPVDLIDQIVNKWFKPHVPPVPQTPPAAS